MECGYMAKKPSLEQSIESLVKRVTENTARLHRVKTERDNAQQRFEIARNSRTDANIGGDAAAVAAHSKQMNQALDDLDLADDTTRRLTESIERDESELTDLRAQLVQETSAAAFEKFRSTARQLEEPFRRIGAIMNALVTIAADNKLEMLPTFFATTGVKLNEVSLAHIPKILDDHLDRFEDRDPRHEKHPHGLSYFYAPHMIPAPHPYEGGIR